MTTFAATSVGDAGQLVDYAHCPSCNAEQSPDEQGMRWCPVCELVWFRWSADDEQRRTGE